MKMLSAVAFAISVLLSSISFAGEQSCTLSVENMSCASCPFIIKQALSNVTGVLDVQVSFEDKTAMVVYDDSHTNVAALTDATTNAGFPSSLVE